MIIQGSIRETSAISVQGSEVKGHSKGQGDLFNGDAAISDHVKDTTPVSSSRTSASAYLHEQRVGLVVDGVRVVKLAVVPHDLPQRRVLLGHGKHPRRVAALRQQLPAWSERQR